MISFLGSFHRWGLALLAALHFSALVNIALCTSAAPPSHFTQFCNYNYTRDKRFTEGRDFISRGTRVHVGTYQFTAFIKVPLSPVQYAKCTGSILDEYHILTAAHCVDHFSEPRHEYDLFSEVAQGKLEVGLAFENDVELSKVSWGQDGNAIVVEVKHFYIHSMYGQKYQSHRNYKTPDIAVLRLQNRLEFDDKVRPVCLASATDELPVPAECTAFGYGRIETSQNSDNYLFYADGLEVYTSEQRRNNPKYVSYLSPEDMLAIANNSETKTICHGDSGGPLMCMAKDSSTEYMKQFAINQAGTSDICGEQQHMFFEPVQLHLDWLEFVALPTLDPDTDSKGRAPEIPFQKCQSDLDWERLVREVNETLDNHNADFYTYIKTGDSEDRSFWYNSICRSYVAYLTCIDNHHTSSACDNIEPILSDPFFQKPLLPYFTELLSNKTTTPGHSTSSTAGHTPSSTPRHTPPSELTGHTTSSTTGHTPASTPRHTPPSVPTGHTPSVPAGHTHAPMTTAATKAKKVSTPQPADKAKDKGKDAEASQSSTAVKPSSNISVLNISAVLVLVGLA